MSETDVTVATDAVAAVRAKLMEDLALVDTVAAAVGKSPRTVSRLIAQGRLPTVMIGRTPYVVISRARELLMSTPTTRHSPVRKGRPRKVAA